MKLFLKNKTLDADLGKFTLATALEQLEQEHFFKDNYDYFLEEKVNENHLKFGVYRDKLTASQTHEFEYDKEKKVIQISSYYSHWLFPGLLIYGMLLPLTFGSLEGLKEEWRTFSVLAILIAVINFSAIFLSLRERAKEIERDLILRLNYLNRQK